MRIDCTDSKSHPENRMKKLQKFWEIDMKGVNMQNWNVIKLEIPKIKFYIKMKEKDKNEKMKKKKRKKKSYFCGF